MAEKVGRHLWPFPKADIFFESHKNKVCEISYNVTVPIIQLCQSFYNQENVLHFAQNIHEMKNSWRFLFVFSCYIFCILSIFPAFDIQNDIVSKNISCLTRLLMQGLNFFLS